MVCMAKFKYISSWLLKGQSMLLDVVNGFRSCGVLQL